MDSGHRSRRRTLLRWAENELNRQTIAAGCNRTTVAKVYDFGYRTTWRKERGMHAFQLPLTIRL